MKRLGINIDHVATVRNARGESHPSPLNAAKLAMKYGWKSKFDLNTGFNLTYKDFLKRISPN